MTHAFQRLFAVTVRRSERGAEITVVTFRIIVHLCCGFATGWTWPTRPFTGATVVSFKTAFGASHTFNDNQLRTSVSFQEFLNHD